MIAGGVVNDNVLEPRQLTLGVLVAENLVVPPIVIDFSRGFPALLGGLVLPYVDPGALATPRIVVALARPRARPHRLERADVRLAHALAEEVILVVHQCVGSLV